MPLNPTELTVKVNYRVTGVHISLEAGKRIRTTETGPWLTCPGEQKRNKRRMRNNKSVHWNPWVSRKQEASAFEKRRAVESLKQTLAEVGDAFGWVFKEILPGLS